MVYKVVIYIEGSRKAFLESKIDERSKSELIDKLEDTSVDFISFGTVVINKRYLKSVIFTELH